MRSLRARLSLVYGGAILVGLVVFAIASLYLFDRLGAGQQDLDLAHAAEQLAAATTLTDGRVAVAAPLLYRSGTLNNSDGLAIIGRDGRRLFTLGNPIPSGAFSKLTATRRYGLQTVGDGSSRIRVAAHRIAGASAIAIAWRNDDADEQLDNHLVLAFTLGAPAVLLTAILGGWFAAGRGLAPLREMASAASTIAVDRLDERIAEPVSNDELAVLARAINTMLARLKAAFDRERRLTGDVSHELRAPLAVIRAAAEHGLQSSDIIGLRASMRTVLLEADELERTIAEVLASARAESEDYGRAEPFDLSAAMFDVIEELYPVSRARNVRVHMTPVAGAVLLYTNGRAFSRALRAVTHNAILHAQSGVCISGALDDGVVRVSVVDDGNGFSDQGLIHAKERFWRDDSARVRGTGSGLGIAIADELVRQAGGSLLLANADGGAKVTFEYPVTASIKAS